MVNAPTLWRRSGISRGNDGLLELARPGLSSNQGTTMFDLEQFTADCRAALAADKSHKHVRDVVARAVGDPTSVLRALGEPKCAGLHKLHQSHDLTVLNVVWAPMMTIMPHNHSMWAVIGIYTGREDNIFWRRLPGSPGRVEAAGAKALCERDAASLGHDIIHSVTNPIPRLTGAIHVYGGDFFDPAHRSEWDPETLLEGPFDPERAVRRFEEANAIFANGRGRQEQ
jgi:predicted metal-dependent enzyme (double-stranded beta helix superfamily)